MGRGGEGGDVAEPTPQDGGGDGFVEHVGGGRGIGGVPEAVAAEQGATGGGEDDQGIAEQLAVVKPGEDGDDFVIHGGDGGRGFAYVGEDGGEVFLAQRRIGSRVFRGVAIEGLGRIAVEVLFGGVVGWTHRSEEHTSELQSLR